jgi:hypothetical protein
MVTMNLTGTIIRNWMDEENHKIMTAALQLGVSETSLRDWLIGRYVPCNDYISRLALAMCVTGLDMSYHKARLLLIKCAQFDRKHPNRRHCDETKLARSRGRSY